MEGHEGREYSHILAYNTDYCNSQARKGPTLNRVPSSLNLALHLMTLELPARFVLQV